MESYFIKTVDTSETTSITSNEKKQKKTKTKQKKPKTKQKNMLGYCCYCLSNLLFTVVNSKVFQ